LSCTFDGTGDLLTMREPLPVNAEPLWISGWFNTNTVSGTGVVLSLFDVSATLNEEWQMMRSSATIIALTNNGGTTAFAQASGVSVNTWHHGVAKFSPDSRTVWLDVGTTDTNTTSTGSPAAIDGLSVGATDYDFLSFQHFNGELAHIMVGTGDIQHSDVARLYAGFMPVVPVAAYWPLQRDFNDYGPQRKFHLTSEADAAIDAANPPVVPGVYRPAPAQVQKDWVPYRFRYQEALRRA
jgi:hypothetical protein